MNNLIGLTGRKRTGKDTAAQALSDYGKVSFAYPLKLMIGTLLAYQEIDTATAQRMIEGDLKEMPSAFLEGTSCRWAMQSIGTEWGRNCIGNNLWVRMALDKAATFEKAVITDVRFPNEAEAVRGRGGIIIKIERPTLVEVEPDGHASEQIDKIKPDFIVHNTSSVNNLQEQIRIIANQYEQRKAA